MRSATALRFAIAVVAVLLAAGPAHAARIFNVGVHGTDAVGCGTVAQPCRTIGHVVGVAASGDRIIVGPGTYPAFALDKAVTLESTHGAGATIVEGSVVFQGATVTIPVAAGAEGAVIGRTSKGFTIRGAEFGIIVDTTDVVIQDNVVSGGVQGNSVGARLTVAGNVISGEIVAGGADTSVLQNAIQGPGVGVTMAGSGAVLRDNVITGASAGAIVGNNIDVVEIRRNTFAANGIGLVVQVGGSHVVVASNNFLGNGNGNCGILNDRDGLVATGNYWGSSSGPGADPADQVCQRAADTTPFLRAPAIVNVTGGR